MAVSNGPNIGLMSFALPGDAFYLDANRFNRWVDFFLAPRAISYAVGTPPGSPANGDTYIVPNGGGTGAWTGWANRIARWTTEITTPAWESIVPKSGFLVFNIATGQFIYFNGTSWVPIGSATGVAFSAHNNSVAQSINPGGFVQKTYNTEVFDIGSYFASSAWTPPAGRTIQINGCVNMAMEADKRLSVSIYKNGSPYKRGTTTTSTVAGQFLSADVSCIDIPNGTDVYTLWVFHDNSVATNEPGPPENSYFQGVVL